MNKIYVVIVVYLIVTFLVARYFSRKESLQEYFLNNRSSSLRLLIFSNVATMIGAGAVITTITITYSSGISFGITSILSYLCGAIALGILVKKIFEFAKKHQIYSIVDFFAQRFDKKNKILVFILQGLLLIVWAAVQIIGITYLINVLTGINYHLALRISTGIIILYTSIGGLKIDIITDFMQFRIILIVFTIMTVIGYQEVGGIHNLVANLPGGHLNPAHFGGRGFMIGSIIFGGLIYIPNTSYRQRILSAKTKDIAQKSFFWSIPFLLIIMAMVVFLGLVASVVLTGIDPNTAVFALMNKILMNKRLIGIGFSCILAVIMSSLDSLLVAGSTIIYKGLAATKDITGKKGLLYARLMTAGFGVVCMIIAICFPDIVTLFLLCSYLALVLVPAVIAGLFAPRISSDASFYSILIPAIILLSLYFIIGKNTFIISTSLSIIIIVFYDRIFKQKNDSFYLLK